MMNQQNLNPWARWKTLLFVPLAALLLQAFARPEINRELGQISTLKSTEFFQGESDLYDLNAEKKPEKVIDTHQFEQTANAVIESENTTRSSASNSKDSENEIFNCISLAAIHPSLLFDSLELTPKELREATAKFEQINNRKITYNGMTMIVNDIAELLKKESNDQLKIYYQFSYTYKDVEPKEKNGKCTASVFSKTIDSQNSACYYVMNGKWVPDINIAIDLVNSIDVYPPEEAVKRFGEKARNGAIALSAKTSKK